MNIAHELILLRGVLGLISVFAVVIGSRFNAPILLLFLVLGMLAGEDGPGRIQFANFGAAYLIGSIALAVILFAGGLKTERGMIRVALWPSVMLATVGVALTAVLVGTAAVWLFSLPWTEALLIGAVLAPTDAAAVNTLLGSARVARDRPAVTTHDLVDPQPGIELRGSKSSHLFEKSQIACIVIMLAHRLLLIATAYAFCVFRFENSSQEIRIYILRRFNIEGCLTPRDPQLIASGAHVFQLVCWNDAA